MTEEQLCFPAYFPEGCPPDDAKAEELCVYRYCMTESVIANDFLSYYQIDSEKYKGNIIAYGLSVFCNKQECIKGMKLPAIKRKGFKSFASGITYINMGVIKQTFNNPSHITWWLYEDVKPETYFSICT